MITKSEKREKKRDSIRRKEYLKSNRKGIWLQMYARTMRFLNRKKEK